MSSWRCDRCGYVHAGDVSGKTPRRCVACGSKRLKLMQADDHWSKGELDSPSTILALLERFATFPTKLKEKLALNLKDIFIHILVSDTRLNSIAEVLTVNELKGYLSLIEKQGFGLALIGNTLVAVSPESIIRPHVGVSQKHLKELRDALARKII
jgi:hypothetical protein